MENADWPTQGLGRMREKSVVITGAAKGIGRATAELFAREGARLVVTDVEEVGLGGLSERLAPSGAEVETVVDDVSVAEEAKKMIAAAVKRFGRIDVLIANADVIDSAKEEQGRLLRRLYEWAVSLDHEGLVRLGTYHA